MSLSLARRSTVHLFWLVPVVLFIYFLFIFHKIGDIKHTELQTQRKLIKWNKVSPPAKIKHHVFYSTLVTWSSLRCVKQRKLYRKRATAVSRMRRVVMYTIQSLQNGLYVKCRQSEMIIRRVEMRHLWENYSQFIVCPKVTNNWNQKEI